MRTTSRPRPPRRPIPVEWYIERVVKKLRRLPNPYRGIMRDVSVLIPLLDDLDPAVRRKMADEIDQALTRTTNQFRSLAKAFRRERPAPILKTVERLPAAHRRLNGKERT